MMGGFITKTLTALRNFISRKEAVSITVTKEDEFFGKLDYYESQGAMIWLSATSFILESRTPLDDGSGYRRYLINYGDNIVIKYNCLRSDMNYALAEVAVGKDHSISLKVDGYHSWLKKYIAKNRMFLYTLYHATVGDSLQRYTLVIKKDGLEAAIPWYLLVE